MTNLTKDETKIIRKITGALKDCIEVHGPITKEFVSSAAKRIYGQIFK